MLAGVTIVDPATTWIEPDGRARARRRRSIRSPSSAARRASPRAPRSARTPSRSTPRSASGRRSARSVTFAPAPSSRPTRRREPSWRSRTRASAPRTKVPHLSYIGDADDRRGHEHRRRHHHRELPAPARQAEGPDDDRRATSGPAIHNGFVAPVEVGDEAWIAAGSVITKDVPPDALAAFAPRQENKEGYARHRKARRLSSPLPGPRGGAGDAVTEPRPGTGSSAGRRSG